ncbi:MAG: hypothetical protein COB12_03370 [Flavobacterium sp.]|nr:MAG: hypothetical protein COB12_03370 [Flavobacterium sp.]
MNKETLLENYFQNKLSASELENFHELVKTDSTFKNEFEFQKNIKLAFRNENRASLKKEFQKIDAKKKLSWASKFLAAASVALLFSIGTYYYSSNSLNPQKVFAANFKPYPNVIHPVVRGNENSTTIENAFVFYENKNYNSFIETIENTNFKNKDYNFYLANAYLATGNTEKSITLLKKYVNNSKPTYKNDANWYLGLSYLQNKDTETAKMYLQKVVESSSFLSNKAKKLLALLD